MSAVRAALVTVALMVAGNPSPARADAGPECYFERSARSAALTTRAGQQVELFEGQLRIDGALESRCSGLPAAHPVAITAWREGFAVAFRDEGLQYWEGGTFRPLAGIPAAPVRALASSGDTLWIGTATDGLWRMSGGQAQRSSHAVLGRAGITALSVDAGGTLHVGTEPAGWWTVQGDTVKRRRREALVGCFRNGVRGTLPVVPGPGCHDDAVVGTLPSDHVTALALYQGRVMAATFDKGIFALDAAGAPRPLPGTPRYVNALLAMDGRLFIGATDGLYAVSGGGAAERVALEIPAPHVNGLAAGKDGTVWLATSHGLVGWGPGGTRVLDEKSGLPSSIVYAVAETEDGALWAGTAHGVARLHPNGVEVWTTDNGKLPHDWVTALLPDGDAVYAGTYDAGVVRLGAHGESEVITAFGKAWINPNGLARIGGKLAAMSMGGGLMTIGAPAPGPIPSQDVTAVLADGGVLWVGTREGLARLR